MEGNNDEPGVEMVGVVVPKLGNNVDKDDDDEEEDDDDGSIVLFTSKL